jgi:threonyl-tRNA synthetase
MINIIFPDGSKKEFEQGISIEEIAGSISSSLKKISVAGIVNGEVYDLNRPILEDAEIRIITKKDKDAFEVLNHSAAHLLAQAVKRLYPNAKFGVGPAIREGFYYDIDAGEVLKEEDLAKIEKMMKRISQEQVQITRSEMPKEEALEFFKDDKYKVELISDLPEGEVISLYTQGEFTDLCRGGHIGSTKNVRFFKLLSLAGAYWRGDSNREQLQRIYGTAWFTEEDLKNHLQVLEERKERDHRKLGKELRIFELNNDAGQGLAMWLPNGYTVRKVLEDYVYKLEKKAGYSHVSTPALGTKKLYEISGHWENYRDNMFPVMERDGEVFVLRPMSCPHHMLVYKSDLRSYRDLPIRYAEIVTQHRYEASGSLSGLERVRAMTLTDAHLFVRQDQIKEEVKAAYYLILQAISDLGLEIDYVELALRDDKKGKFHKNDELWDLAEQMMKEILEEENIEYTPMKGEAAFYGPKIDIQVRTAMGHVITMSTVQLDFLLPDRFDLTYIGSDGEKHRPVVIHRGLISTWERLMSILLEQYKGAFPTWLAPVQIKLIPVSLEAHVDYAKKLNDLFIDHDLRSELDLREEKLGYKIREAQTLKIPYQLVVGDNEVDSNQVRYRKYGEEFSFTANKDDFIELVKLENLSKGKATKRYRDMAILKYKEEVNEFVEKILVENNNKFPEGALKTYSNFIDELVISYLDKNRILIDSDFDETKYKSFDKAIELVKFEGKYNFARHITDNMDFFRSNKVKAYSKDDISAIQSLKQMIYEKLVNEFAKSNKQGLY